MKYSWISLFLFLVGISTTYAQLPKTDVYLLDLKNINTAPIVLSIKFLNEHNRNGYNNQVRFFSYDELYMSCGIDTAQSTDIYKFNLKTEKMERVTDTEKIAEFSPTPTPDMMHFTTIRTEADGKTQTFWQYPLDRSNLGKRLLPSLSTIGYHTWLGKDTAAIFIVGTPHTLAIAHTKTNKVEVIADNIGRCLRTYDKNTVIFVQKGIAPSDPWLLKEYHIQDKAMRTITTMPKGREDFDRLGSHYVVGDGSVIKGYPIQGSGTWTTLIDLTSSQVTNINRIHTMRDRLAFVNNK
jgi:hypothetical protein